jgi:hypothetical protein
MLILENNQRRGWGCTFRVLIHFEVLIHTWLQPGDLAAS